MSQYPEFNDVLLNLVCSIPDEVLEYNATWSDSEDWSYSGTSCSYLRYFFIMLSVYFVLCCQDKNLSTDNLPPETLQVASKMAGILNIILACEIRDGEISSFTTEDIIGYLLDDGIIPCPFYEDDEYNEGEGKESIDLYYQPVRRGELLLEMFSRILSRYAAGRDTVSKGGKKTVTPYGPDHVDMSLAASDWAEEYQRYIRWQLEQYKTGKLHSLFLPNLVYHDPGLFSLKKAVAIDGKNHLNFEL